MKRISIALILCCLSATTFAGGLGFGVQLGAYSPTSGIEDNDNGVVIGGHIKFKLAVIGVKVEGFYVDSSGRYASALGDEFGSADIDVESILSADVMFYPLGGLFFLQAGVNHTNLDFDGLDINTLDNGFGYEGGLGITLLDKLMIQGKILYTPDAFEGTAVDAIDGLDDTSLVGYMVTAGWNF